MTCLGIDPSESQPRPRAQKSASRFRGLSLVLSVGLFAAGCDTFTFKPPRPAELTTKVATPRASAAGAAASSKAPTVEVVLTPRIAGDLETLSTAARLQAGIDKMRVQVSAPPEGADAKDQAELVRQAIARKPPVIVIEAPAAPLKELIEAAAEARKAGVAVVSAGRPLAAEAESTSASASASPMVVVVTEPLKNSADMIVADAVRVVKKAGLAPDSGAVILIDPTIDCLVQDRVDALREALKGAGVKQIDDLKFERTVKDAQAKLIEYLDAHPETTLVFAVDAGGVLAADDATGVLKEKHRYAIAGYSNNDAARNQVVMGEYAAIGVDAFDRLLRRAVNVASGLIQGKDVPERVKIEVPVHESSEGAGLPRMKVSPPEKDSMVPKAHSPAQPVK